MCDCPPDAGTPNRQMGECGQVFIPQTRLEIYRGDRDGHTGT